VTVAAKPSNTKRPSVRAPAWNPGEVATAGEGNWTGDPARYEYAWHRCTGTTVPCSKIADADGSTYTLTPADEGHRLRVYVTAHNEVGNTTRYSTPGPVVGIPVRTGGPSVSGRILTGDTLTVDTGQWSPPATGYDVEWVRCSTLAHSSCTPVGSADATDGDTTYTLVGADTAARLRARVVARNAAGSSRPALSTASDAVNVPANTRRPKVTGNPAPGQVLTTEPGGWIGAPTRFEFEWLRCTTVAFSTCTVLAGETGTTYTVADADAGRLIRSRVRAFNANGGSRRAYSVVTPPLPRAPRGPGR
jgi:hypothetical protein